MNRKNILVLAFHVLVSYVMAVGIADFSTVGGSSADTAGTNPDYKFFADPSSITGSLGTWAASYGPAAGAVTSKTGIVAGLEVPPDGVYGFSSPTGVSASGGFEVAFTAGGPFSPGFVGTPATTDPYSHLAFGGTFDIAPLGENNFVLELVQGDLPGILTTLIFGATISDYRGVQIAVPVGPFADLTFIIPFAAFSPGAPVVVAPGVTTFGSGAVSAGSVSQITGVFNDPTSDISKGALTFPAGVSAGTVFPSFDGRVANIYTVFIPDETTAVPEPSSLLLSIISGLTIIGISVRGGKKRGNKEREDARTP